ncbi:MAG: ROK family protein [Victivallaceae bacterium]|nr:ROK family protein [Victivallaceae bacterium]
MNIKHKPELDPDYLPPIVWKRNYLEAIKKQKDCEPIAITMKRAEQSVSRWDGVISPSHPDTAFYLERIFKHLLWMKGGYEIKISNKAYAAQLAANYSAQGERKFDFASKSKTSGRALEISYAPLAELSAESEIMLSLGGQLDGCRIGFDLGGSDRKCAAIKDGVVLFSEEIAWDPYFQTNPQYHLDGIRDSLRRAAAHLPRVNAIGGSAAGVYVDNEVRAASLFRGIGDEDFKQHIRYLFHDLQKEWCVPFEVLNDGEVTALAGSMSLESNAVLGISMGTSVAAGYVTTTGELTPWLNELAFVPVDYRPNAPIDEWSGDRGCAVQYFCQQGVARLAKVAGLNYQELPFPEQLIKVQELMKQGDERAAAIYRTIGCCLGYTIADWTDFYDIEKILFLGRVSSGVGGEIIMQQAQKLLTSEFAELAQQLEIVTPDETMKRHGQAIAAASLPSIKPETTQ